MITRVAAPSAEWLSLRRALWPDCPEDEHLSEMAEFAADPTRFAQFLARSPAGEAIGLAEVAVRTDYVNGTESSPVAFLEGLYVAPPHRNEGVARGLVAEVENWARERGLRELASDTQLDNLQSQAVHGALGFTETERVVYFRKAVQPR
ncbi:MAG: GNAT family N-acetyltransferase [Betaproteobacteria bacterium]|nr:GNAT family N-acetyltransferase [Betaproteobacteria bacterium]